MENKHKRIVIIDQMLKGDPVSFLQIAKELENELQEIKMKKTHKVELSSRDLTDHYSDVFRKDIQTIREILKTTMGLSPDMLETVGNNRNKKYHYRDNTFSILPYLDYRYSTKDYKSLERAVDLMRGTLPEQVFELVEFSLKSRVEYNFGETEKSIDYGDNLSLKGRERLPIIYKVLNRRVLKISYKTFKDLTFEFVFHPYLLKQFNSRWFLFGRHEEKGNDYWNVPVDRITKMEELKNVEFINRPNQYMKYFDSFIGVSEKVWLGEEGDENDRLLLADVGVTSKKILIVIRVEGKGTWGRIKTKPLHISQVELDNGFNEVDNCGRIRLDIIPNVEFYNKIMELGENVIVESPSCVREIVMERLNNTLNKYKNG